MSVKRIDNSKLTGVFFSGGTLYKLRFLLFLILIVSFVTFAADNISWPCFHELKRDNLATETGLMQAWQASEQQSWAVPYAGARRQ